MPTAATIRPWLLLLTAGALAGCQTDRASYTTASHEPQTASQTQVGADECRSPWLPDAP